MRNPNTCEQCGRERVPREWFWTYRYPVGQAPDEFRARVGIVVCGDCYQTLSGKAPRTLSGINEQRARRKLVTA